MFLSPRRESNLQPSDLRWDALINDCYQDSDGREKSTINLAGRINSEFNIITSLISQR